MASKKGIEAGRAYVKATLDDSLFRKGLGAMKNGLMSFGRALPSIASGIFIFQKLGNVVSSAANKIVSSLEDIALIDRAGKAFGATAEQASGLFGVFKASGATNARENIESIVTLGGRIKDVLTGTGKESKKLFEGLSVSAEELSKLPIDEQFFRLHEAIMELPSPLDRVNRLMLAFGEDGGKTLIGTLSKSTPELRELAKTFEITSQETANATKAQQAMAMASAAVQRVWNKIAVTVAPLIVAAIEAVPKVIQKIKTALTDVAKQFQPLSDAIANAFGGVRDALANGDVEQAGRVLMAGLEAVWAETAVVIEDAWGDMLGGMRNAWADFVTFLASSSASIESFWEGMKSKFNESRVAVDDFQNAHPEIFNKDPLGLNTPEQNEAVRQKQRDELLGRADAQKSASERLADEARIIQQQAGNERMGRESARKARAEELRQRAEDARTNLAEMRTKAKQDAVIAERRRIAAEKEAAAGNTGALDFAVGKGSGQEQNAVAKSSNAINTALVVGSTEGQAQFLKATAGGRSDEERQKNIEKATQETAKGVNKLAKNYIVISPAKSA